MALLGQTYACRTRLGRRGTGACGAPSTEFPEFISSRELAREVTHGAHESRFVCNTPVSYSSMDNDGGFHPLNSCVRAAMLRPDEMNRKDGLRMAWSFHNYWCAFLVVGIALASPACAASASFCDVQGGTGPGLQISSDAS